MKILTTKGGGGKKMVSKDNLRAHCPALTTPLPWMSMSSFLAFSAPSLMKKKDLASSSLASTFVCVGGGEQNTCHFFLTPHNQFWAGGERTEDMSILCNFP